MSSSIAEFFTLRAVAAEIAHEPMERRAERTAVVTRARQKRDAADALWSVAQPVEALRLMLEALRLFRDAALDGAAVSANATPTEAVAAAAPAPSPSALELRLVALGASARDARATAATLDKLDAVKVPELNRDARGPETDTFRALAEAAAILDAAVSPRVLTGREVMVRRLSRSAWALVALTALGLAAWMALRGGPDVLATATGVYGNDPMFGPDRAIDGDPATEWLLPDAVPGVLELRLKHARRIERVRLLNGHNREFNDRAVNAYDLELYAGTRLLKTVSGSFTRFESAPRPTYVTVGVDAVDRVRFVVKSHHRMSAALAEISFE